MKIRVGVGQTIQNPNNQFENTKPSIEIEDELQFVSKNKNISKTCDKELETPEECHDRLSRLAHKLLYKEIKKITGE